MNGPLLRASRLRAGYGKVEVLQGVDLQVKSGEVVAMIGPNGAGKSTVLKAIIGHLRPTGGAVHLRGHDVTGQPPEQQIRRGMVFVPQGRAVFPSLSVAENLRMGGYTLGSRSILQERLAAMLDRFPRLAERRTQAAGTLSGGERQILALAMALMTEPKILLLDEPSVGLAPRAVKDVMAEIRWAASDGRGILMVEQNATMALRHCDRAYLLVGGQNRMAGTGAQLLADPGVQRAYLGGT